MKFLEFANCASLINAIFSNLPNLKLLSTNSCENLQIVSFSELPSLQTLNLAYCPNITELSLTGLSALTGLFLNNCFGLSGLVLNGLNALRLITIQGCNFTQEAIDAMLSTLTDEAFNQLESVDLIVQNGIVPTPSVLAAFQAAHPSVSVATN